MASKTGGGKGTNQYAVKGVSIEQPKASAALTSVAAPAASSGAHPSASAVSTLDGATLTAMALGGEFTEPELSVAAERFADRMSAEDLYEESLALWERMKASEGFYQAGVLVNESGMLRHPNCPDEVLEEAVRGESSLYAMDALANPALDDDLRSEIAHGGDFERAQFTLANPNVEEDEIDAVLAHALRTGSPDNVRLAGLALLGNSKADDLAAASKVTGGEFGSAFRDSLAEGVMRAEFDRMRAEAQAEQLEGTLMGALDGNTGTLDCGQYGTYANDVLHSVDLYHDEDSGKVYATGNHIVNFIEGLGQYVTGNDSPDRDEVEEWLNEHGDEAEAWIKRHYGCDIGSGNGEWDFVPATFDLEADPTDTPEDVIRRLEQETKVVELHNESDPGTYNSRNLWRQMASDLHLPYAP